MSCYQVIHCLWNTTVGEIWGIPPAHDSLVVVPQLPLDPSVQAPATIRQAAPCHVPSAGLQQPVVESIGAGLVVLLLVLAAAQGWVGGLGGGVRPRNAGTRASTGMASWWWWLLVSPGAGSPAAP